jgi:hypothetical protein
MAGKGSRLAVLRGAACIPAICGALSGCAYLNTRPGHPDSYRTNRYYDPSLRWNTNVAADGTAAQSGRTQIAAGQPPPAYTTTNVPRDIWKARAAAYNKHLEYEAASYKAQDIQDEMTVPLFGAAVATGAVAIARASTVAVAATGLGAGAAGGAYGYTHPGTDAATDLTADAGLLCVVDQSHILQNLNDVPLVLDRAAIEDALSLLEADAADLLGKSNPSTADQKTIDAVHAAEAAAHTTLAALQSAIADYNQLPSVIYKAVDAIDMSAKSAGQRSTDYASILSGIKAAGATQASTDTAKANLDTSQTKAATAQASSGQSASSGEVTAPKGDASADAPPTSPGAATPALLSVTSPVAGDALQARTGVAAASAAADPAAAQDSASKVTTLTTIVTTPTLSDLTKINRLAEIAMDDMPNPTFAAIGSEISTCTSPKQ